VLGEYFSPEKNCFNQENFLMVDARKKSVPNLSKKVLQQYSFLTL
jgi:hypothetical protein